MALAFVLRSIGLAWNVVNFIVLAYSAYQLAKVYYGEKKVVKTAAKPVAENVKTSYLEDFKKAYASKFKVEPISDEMIQRLSQLFGPNFLQVLTERMKKEGQQNKNA